LRGDIVADDASLSLWKAEGYYDPDTASRFLCAAARHLGPIVLLAKAKIQNGRSNTYEYRFHDSFSYDSDGEKRLTFEELKRLMSDETEKPLLLECSRGYVSPFLHVPRPKCAETMLTAIATSDYGVWSDRSSYYASAAMAAYCKASGEENTHTRGELLPCGFYRVIITLDGEYMAGPGRDGRSRAAQIFRYFHFGFRMKLLLLGKPESDCVTFQSPDGRVCYLLSADLLQERREYAKVVTSQDLLALEQTLSKKRDATVDWSKMKQLSEMGVTQCPSSGMPVWNPDSMTEDMKREFEELVKKLVETCGPKSGQKRPRSE